MIYRGHAFTPFVKKVTYLNGLGISGLFYSNYNHLYIVLYSKIGIFFA